jgi:hypothetical protein
MVKVVDEHYGRIRKIGGVAENEYFVKNADLIPGLFPAPRWAYLR